MISHKHKCIFIHIPKTGGKSIKKSLFGIPEYGPNSDQWSGEELPDYFVDPFGHHRLREFKGIPNFRSYFKFAFVRNPFDRLVSAFSYLEKGGSNRFDAAFREAHLKEFEGDFNRFVEGFHDQFDQHVHFVGQYTWINTFWRRVGVDFVGRFEEFDRDLTYVAEKLGIEFETVARINQSDRKESYRSYYNDRSKEIVERKYGKDLKLFNYQF